MLKEFGTYIEAQVASLSMSGGSRNLYLGRRPQNADDVCTVIEEPFPDPTDGFPSDQVQKTFRLVCRGSEDDYFSARDVASSIHNAIHGKMQVLLPTVASGTQYVVNIEVTEPSSLGPDEKHRPRIILYCYLETRELGV